MHAPCRSHARSLASSSLTKWRRVLSRWQIVERRPGCRCCSRRLLRARQRTRPPLLLLLLGRSRSRRHGSVSICLLINLGHDDGETLVQWLIAAEEPLYNDVTSNRKLIDDAANIRASSTSRGIRWVPFVSTVHAWHAVVVIIRLYHECRSVSSVTGFPIFWVPVVMTELSRRFR